MNGSRPQVLVACVALVAVLGCGPVPARDVGAQLFADPRLSTAESNPFSCKTCHAVGDDDRILSGRSLVDVVRRERWWGGAVTSLLDATNVCVTFFMRGKALERAEPKSRALFEYLASLGDPGASQPARTLTIVENIGSVGRGDPSAGRAVWERACQECHGAPSTGAGRMSESISIVPESSRAFAEESGFAPDVVVVEKVRHGRFFGVGGVMPPFSRESLYDEEMGQLLGFLDP